MSEHMAPHPQIVSPSPQVEAKAKIKPPDWDATKAFAEKHLDALPGRCDEAWSGWAQVHAAMVEAGVADNSAECVVAVQHWVGELLRLRILEPVQPSGGLRVREQPKGCGWYVPPPKPKPLPKRGGRRGKAAAAG